MRHLAADRECSSIFQKILDFWLAPAVQSTRGYRLQAPFGWTLGALSLLGVRICVESDRPIAFIDASW